MCSEESYQGPLEMGVGTDRQTLGALPTARHRWELPVLRYHGIGGNYHYPILGVIVSVFLRDFIRQNYHKNQSDCYPFFLIMVNYQTFPINHHILKFQMYDQYLFSLPKYPNNVSKKN